MKYLITERQSLLLEEKVLQIPSLEFFNNDWEVLQKYLEKKGNPLYSIIGNVNLIGKPIESLGNLVSVGGSLYLSGSEIESLGNLESVGGDLDLLWSEIESLGKLVSVGGSLVLRRSLIKSLGELQSVGGDLHLQETPLSKKYYESEIRDMVNVAGDIYR